jgi:hypothetical protein
MRIAGLIGLLLFGACGLGACSRVSLGTAYTVRIDPTFTAAQQETVLAALADWEANTQVRLTPIIEAASGRREHEVVIHNSTLAAIVHEHGADPLAWGITFGSTSGEDVDGGEMWIATDAVPTGELDFQGVIAHEVGHAMGLHHEPDCLMSPTCIGWSRVVAPKDAAQWVRTRG